MRDLKSLHGKKIDYFGDDVNMVSKYPSPKGVFIFSYETHKGEHSEIDKFYIIHEDKNGNEVERFDATAKSVTKIKWTNTKGQLND